MIDLRRALELGVTVVLDDIPADEFCAMLIYFDECKTLERELASRASQ
jgi:hypothetical protein